MKHALMCLAALAAFSTGVLAGEAVPDCTGVADIKSKSKTLHASTPLMAGLSKLEVQGESNFKPDYPKPSSQCVFARFDVAGAPVIAMYSPFEKGETTLHYRFTTGSADAAREILVIYDGMASLMAKKPVFFVVEKRAGTVSYYEMYREQPSYAALEPLVTSIVDGSAQPLAQVRWPPGAKEPVIDKFDSTRLK